MSKPPLELHLPLSGGEDPVALLAAANGLSADVPQ